MLTFLHEAHAYSNKDRQLLHSLYNSLCNMTTPTAV